MSGNLFCSEFVTTHLESFRNLEKLALHLKVELPLNFGNSGIHKFFNICIKIWVSTVRLMSIFNFSFRLTLSNLKGALLFVSKTIFLFKA